VILRTADDLKLSDAWVEGGTSQRDPLG